MKKSFKEILEENKAKSEQQSTPKPVVNTSFDKVMEEKSKPAPQPKQPQSPPAVPTATARQSGTGFGTANHPVRPTPVIPPPRSSTIAKPMSQSFEDVMFLVPGDGSNYKCQAGELLVAYQAGEKRASRHHRRSLVGRLTSLWSSGDVVHYRIRPKQQVTLPSFDLGLKDLARNVHPIECSVTILGIAPDREEDTVVRLAELGDPLETLRGYVATWLDDFAVAERRNSRDIIENFGAGQRSEASKHIAVRALEVVGLKVECGFYFPEQDQKLPVLQLQLADLRIRETSLPGQLSATLEIQLHLPIDPKRSEYARRVRKSETAIRLDLEAVTRDWFRSSCTLEQFCFARDDVRRSLENAVRNYAEDKLYMEFGSLTVQCEVPFPKDFRIRLEYSSKGVVQPGNHELMVKHQLVVRRTDLGRFYMDGPRPYALGATQQGTQEAWNRAFEDWVDDLLKRVTHHTFFGKSYAEVSLRFKELCAGLKDEVQEEFKRIGFTVHQLISLPDDPQITSVLERKFTFDTNAIHCKTREAKVDYGISTHIALEVNSLREIEKYLRPGQGLQNQFVHVATEAVRNTVRTLDPETLYTKFAIADPKGGAPSPEEKIDDALKTALTEKFDAIARTISITLTPEPTDVTRLYDELRPFESHRCPVVVETRGSRGEQLTFFVDYRVDAIAPEGWPKFQEQCRKNLGADTAEKAKKMFEAMDNAFKSRAGTKLISLSSAQLTSPHQDMPKVVEAFGLAEALQEISNYLGLSIRIMNIEPQPGKWTELERQRELDYYEAARLDYHAASAQYRERQQEYEPGDPRLEESRQRVEECERKLRNFGTGHDEYFADAPTLPKPSWENILRLHAAGDKSKSESEMPPPKPTAKETESNS
jgi:hypothetical protein